jgi:hypothetical protein
MRAGTLATLAVLAFLLAGVIAFTYFGLSVPGRPMSAQVFAALIGGALTSLIAGVGLMGLMFYSHRKGLDEPARLLPPPK